MLAARVRDHYEHIGANPGPGVSPEALADFERRHQCKLPRSVADFCLTLDGVDADPLPLGLDFLALWPMAEWGRVPDRVAEFQGIPNYAGIVATLPHCSDYIAFGDGLVWSHVLAFRLADGSDHTGPVVWLSGETHAIVARTFEEFWELYLTQPAAVLWPNPNGSEPGAA